MAPKKVPAVLCEPEILINDVISRKVFITLFDFNKNRNLFTKFTEISKYKICENSTVIDLLFARGAGVGIWRESHVSPPPRRFSPLRRCNKVKFPPYLSFRLEPNEKLTGNQKITSFESSVGFNVADQLRKITVYLAEELYGRRFAQSFVSNGSGNVH
jgi:hypothetical protein